MPEFKAVIAATKRTPESHALLAQIQSGSEGERDAALDRLLQIARDDGTPDAWNTLGVGFHFARLNDEAVRIFEHLVRESLDNDVFRLNLATSYSQTQQIALCRERLLHLADHGSTEQMRRLGREQLQGYDHFLRNTEQDRKLQDLQMRGLRQRIQKDRKQADDFLTLVRLMLHRGQLEPQGTWLEQATEVLEAGVAAFPKSVPLTEHLIGCYLRHDPNNRLDRTFKRLEKLAPDSKILRMVEDLDDESTRRFNQNSAQRADSLLQAVSHGPEESEDDGSWQLPRRSSWEA